MDSTTPAYGFEDRVREDLGSTGAVDPDLFVQACLDLEVWKERDCSSAFEHMMDEFEDSAISATHRYLDVAVCLHDGTLTEFLASTDDGQVAFSHAVLVAAATAPLDEETFLIDREEWFAEIMRLTRGDDEDDPLR